MKINKPNKEELACFSCDIKSAAEKWEVSERTIRRWLQAENLYKPRKGFGPGKLKNKEIEEIRRLKSSYTQAQLGKMFNVSQAMVGRIVNNISHPVDMKIRGFATVRTIVSEKCCR